MVISTTIFYSAYLRKGKLHRMEVMKVQAIRTNIKVKGGILRIVLAEKFAKFKKYSEKLKEEDL